MKRVLVTGAGGQLGKTIRDLAHEYSDLQFLFLDKKNLDITQAEQVMKRFREFRPDYCINCAAYTNVDQAEKTPEPAFAVNVLGVENLVRACRETGTAIVHISTDYVFDGTKAGGYYPNDTPNPINEYGRTKLMGEQIIQRELERYYIIRTSWLYSKKYGPNFYLTIVDKARRGEQLLVTDAQVGRPTNAVSLAKYLLEIILGSDCKTGINHFSDENTMTRHQFARNILKENDLLSNCELLKTSNYVTFAQRPRISVLLK